MTPERRNFHHKAANELASSNTSNTLCFDYFELEAELSRVEAERDALAKAATEMLDDFDYPHRIPSPYAIAQLRRALSSLPEGSGIAGKGETE